MFKAKPQCVEHLIDGKDSWKYGHGQFLRLRALGGSLAVTLIGGGLFAWMTFFREIPDTNPISSTQASLAGGFLVSIWVTRELYLQRQKAWRTQDIRSALHEVSHYIRDQSVNAYESKKSDLTGFFSICDQACDKIANLFREITGDKTIKAALRIADRADGVKGGISYRTVGRSAGMNPNRKSTSEPISIDSGIPRFFLSNSGSGSPCGVLIYHDLNEAAQLGAFKETKNERLNHKDVRTMMVAPINGWGGQKNSMLGLIYIVSERDPFKPQHVDPLRAIADILGTAIPQIVDSYFDKRSNRFKT